MVTIEEHFRQKNRLEQKWLNAAGYSANLVMKEHDQQFVFPVCIKLGDPQIKYEGTVPGIFPPSPHQAFSFVQPYLLLFSMNLKTFKLKTFIQDK